jgi:hypothetical protein
MGHIFSAISPCELTLKGRRDAESLYPGLRFPDEGRLPSRAEIEAVLAAHSDWQVELDTGKDWWTAFIRSPTLTASLRVDDYTGDPARPQSFHFDTGDPDLVVDIAVAIAERCGSFLVVDESGGIVVLVNQDGSRSDLGSDSAGGSRPATRPQSG